MFVDSGSFMKNRGGGGVNKYERKKKEGRERRGGGVCPHGNQMIVGLFFLLFFRT